jgi:hypothetical protein
MTGGLTDAEFSIAGHIVADIAVIGGSNIRPDGSTELQLEALTITE